MLLVALAAVAVPALAVVLVLPFLRRTGARDVRRAMPLVPHELADAHAAVAALADEATRRIADDTVIDVAVVLAGRPARGGAQRRFVQARTDALLDLAAELQERNDALAAARAEVDELSGLTVDTAPESRPEPESTLAKMVFVVLLPAFLAGDVIRAVVDGTALRLRAAGRVVVASARRWHHARAAVALAVRQARRRFVAARLRGRRSRRRCGAGRGTLG